MRNADNILFRASCNGYIMTEPKGKSNLEKYNDVCILEARLQNDYSLIVNKETKAAAKKWDSICSAGKIKAELSLIKNNAELSETCKKYLIELYARETFGRFKEIKSKYLDKGNEREPDSTTLLSVITKHFYKQNTIRLTNDFVTGVPDLFKGVSVDNADETNDTKTSWSLLTYLAAKHSPLDHDYYWQGHSYMDLTGAKKHTVSYCLVNGTAQAISDEKRKLAYSLNILDPDNAGTPKYVEKCKQIEINHIFDIKAFQNENPWFEFHNDVDDWTFDIPKEERLFQFTFNRDESEIERLHKRIADCRNWMNENLFK